MGFGEDEDMSWLADQHIAEEEQIHKERMEVRGRLWDALAAFVKSEAAYAAGELMNRNGCAEELRRREFEDEAREAFMQGDD